jgi:hypothetical protein
MRRGTMEVARPGSFYAPGKHPDAQPGQGLLSEG